MKNLTIFLGLLWAWAWLPIACQKRVEPDRVPASIVVTGLAVKKAFEGNWSVQIRVENRSNAEFALEKLSDSDLYVTTTSDERRSAHPLSVGLGKKLLVEPMRNKVTSFLFLASPSPPTTLHLRGRVVPLNNVPSTPETNP